MNQIMNDLYMIANDQISSKPDYQEKIRALAIAKLAILDELEQRTDNDIASLLDVYTSLDGERQELHEQVIFQTALRWGMELGRLGLKA